MKAFRVIYEFQNQRRVLLVDHNKNEALEPILAPIIQCNAFTIKIKSLDAIVNFTSEIFEGDELIIHSIQTQNQSIQANQAISLPNLVQNQPPTSTKIETKVDPGEILKKNVQGKDLLNYANEWALQHSFKLKICEGYKRGKKEVTRTLMCKVKECMFRLVFSADLQQDQVEYDDMNFSIKSMKLEHNHKLDYVEKSNISNEVIAKINIWKGKTKTLVDLKNMINQEFNSNFDYHQITYQVNKLMKENFGKADEDAETFLTEIECDIKNNGGFYDFEIDKENKLQKVVYLSSQMLDYAEKFLDIIIVDATYRRNRFNMPLVNVCGINNYGGTILLAFGLLNDETKNSYDWLFGKLRKAWKSNPNFFISDESNEIIYGILAINMETNLFLGIEKTFLQGAYYVHGIFKDILSLNLPN